MCADHVEPRFVEKLTKSRCARAFVLRVWVAVGFNADDPLDHGVNSHCSSRLLPLRIGMPISVVPTKPDQTKRTQRHACYDQTPKYPTAARLGCEVRRHFGRFISSVARNVNFAAWLRKGRRAGFAW